MVACEERISSEAASRPLMRLDPGAYIEFDMDKREAVVQGGVAFVMGAAATILKEVDSSLRNNGQAEG